MPEIVLLGRRGRCGVYSDVTEKREQFCAAELQFGCGYFEKRGSAPTPFVVKWHQEYQRGSAPARFLLLSFRAGAMPLWK